MIRNYGGHPFRVGRFLRFGTWIGGDRDGNPFVTAEVTRQTIELLRGDALRRHLEACRDMENRLSLSDRYHDAETPVAAAVRKSRERWPNVNKAVARCHPRESYRQWLVTIRFRLEATQAMDGRGRGQRPDCFRFAGLSRRRRASSRRATRGRHASRKRPQDLGREHCPGMARSHCRARLSYGGTRHSRRVGPADQPVQELAAELGLSIDFLGLREDRKQAFLLTPPPPEVVRRLAPERLSPPARETLDLFRLLARTAANYGPRPLAR